MSGPARMDGRFHAGVFYPRFFDENLFHQICAEHTFHARQPDRSRGHLIWVSHSHDEPYRSAPESTTVERARPLTRRRPWARIVGAVIAAATAPLGIVIYAARFGTDWLGTDAKRQEADARLRALPFPVTHDRPWAVITASRPRPIHSVTVRLERSLDGRESERWCRAVLDLVPRLTVIADGAAIQLTTWPWRNYDLVLLAELMDAWGLALHAAHRIISVDVGWTEGGPTQSI